GQRQHRRWRRREEGQGQPHPPGQQAEDQGQGLQGRGRRQPDDHFPEDRHLGRTDRGAEPGPGSAGAATGTEDQAALTARAWSAVALLVFAIWGSTGGVANSAEVLQRGPTLDAKAWIVIDE